VKAYRVICSVCPDIETIVAAVSAGSATTAVYWGISDMYPDVHYGMFTTRRAPEFDALAAPIEGRAVIGWRDRHARAAWGCCESEAS
jgi:hypothetical protein